jgi:hypothetical protein
VAAQGDEARMNLQAAPARPEALASKSGSTLRTPALRRPQVALLALLAGFMLCAATYSIAAPLWEASDESEHFQYIVYLLREHTLPSRLPSIQPGGNNEANQPPLYYLLVAPVAAGLDLSDAVRIRLNPQMGWEGDPAGIAATAHLLDEGWPYHGAFLAAHRVRLLSTLLGAVTILLTYAIASACTANRRTALLAAALLALLPGFIFTSATIDNDALANVLGALLLLIAVQANQLGARRAALCFGTVSCLALMTKLDLLLPVAFGAILLVRSSKGRVSIASFALTVLPMIPAFGFWLWRMLQGQRNLVGDRVTWPPPLPGSSGPIDWTLPWRFAVDFWTSFFGAFGRENVHMPPWLYALYGAVYIGGLIAAFAVRRRCEQDGLDRHTARLLGVWATIMVLAIVGRYFLISGPRTGYASSRFLYPALPALVILIASGWQRLARLRPLLHWAVPAVLAAGTCSAVALPWLLIRPAYPPPFPVTNVVPAGPSAVAGGQFVNSVTLAAIQLPQTPVTAGQAFAVTFYWQVARPLPDGTWLFVHVLNAAGQTAAAFDGAPLYNTLPLSYWRHGDVVIDREILTVHGDAPAGPYQVRVGWYDQKTGVRVPLASGGNELTAGSVDVKTAGP